jgi:putative ABC transport system permease protein
VRLEHWWYKVPLLLRSLFRLRQTDQDLHDELQDHLLNQIRENMERGMPPEAARHEALLALGGLAQVEEQVRAARSAAWIQQLMQDLHYGARKLRNNPKFTLAVISTLGFAIGIATAVFSFTDAIVLRPFPYSDSERIVRIAEQPRNRDSGGPLSPLTYLEVARRSRSFSGVSAEMQEPVTLSGGDFAIALVRTRVSLRYFDVFHARTILGRTFTPDDFLPGRNAAMILSDSVWHEHFDADTGIIGRSVKVNGEAHTIMGVIEKGHKPGWLQGDVWTPLPLVPNQANGYVRWLTVAAKLAPGITADQARTEMNLRAMDLAARYPSIENGVRLWLEPHPKHVVQQRLMIGPTLALVTAGLVLLIGCVNIVNLVLAQGVRRQREISTRWALGASRGRLVRQFLSESVLLAFPGTVAALLVAGAVVLLIHGWTYKFDLPVGMLDARIDINALAFTSVIMFLVTLIFGTASAFHGRNGKIAASLSEAGRNITVGRTVKRIQSVLAVSEVALAFVLSFFAVFLAINFRQAMRAESGFSGNNYVIAEFALPENPLEGKPQNTDMLERISSRLRDIPGITGAALTNALPRASSEFTSFGLVPDAASMPSHYMDRPCALKIVSPLYFVFTGQRMKVGRGIEESDDNAASRVAVVNDAMRKQYFRDRDPVNSYIVMPLLVAGQHTLGPGQSWRIVGLVPDETATGGAGVPAVYVSWKQRPLAHVFAISRTADAPALLKRAVQATIRSLDEDQAVRWVHTVDELKTIYRNDDRVLAAVLGAMAGTALLLASFGIYGVLSCLVEQQSRETAIRIALGSVPGRQVSRVLRSGAFLTAAGAGLGILGTLALFPPFSRLVLRESLTTPQIPMVMALMVAVVIALSFVASLIPANRAAHVDPATVLRHE